MRRAPASKAFPSLEEIKSNKIPQRVGESPSSVVLAFDISSTCVGWALDCDGKPVTWGKLVFKTTATMGEKLVALEEFFVTLLNTYRPNVLLVEKVLSRKASTTSRHNQLFGIILKCWFQFSATELKESWIISPRTVKRVMRVRRGIDHDQNKEIMVNKINQILGIKLKYAKNSAYDSDDDTADAIAILITYRRLNSAKRGKADNA